MCGSAGGTEGAAPAGDCTGNPRAAATPSAVRSTDAGGSIPDPRGPSQGTPPQLHIPSSQTAGRARVTGPKTPAFPRPRARSSRGRLQPTASRRLLRPALGRGDGRRRQLRPTASRRERSRRRPPALPRRGAGAVRRASQAGPDRGSTLTSTSRPLFLKLLMRWFSKPGFSAMAARGSGGGYSCGGGGGESRCGRGRRSAGGGQGEGERRARSVTTPSARWQQRQGRRGRAGGQRGGAGPGGSRSEKPRAPREASVTCPGRLRAWTPSCLDVQGIIGVTLAPPNRTSPQPLGAASYVPAVEPDLAAFTAPQQR